MNLTPESIWKVTRAEGLVIVVDSFGARTSFNTEDERRVYVRTTDEWPLLTDVWYGIETSDSTIEVPQGCTGEDNLISYFLSLPGFEMKGMNCVENRIHDCWSKKERSGA